MTDPTPAALIAQIEDTRPRTLALIQGLDEAQLMDPRLAIVNPVRWEAGRRCIAAESRSHNLGSAGLWPALSSPASRR
jgi:hypothetical protein